MNSPEFERLAENARIGIWRLKYLRSSNSKTSHKKQIRLLTERFYYLIGSHEILTEIDPNNEAYYLNQLEQLAKDCAKLLLTLKRGKRYERTIC